MGIGDPPEHLDSLAKEHWRRIATLLNDSGKARPADSDALTFYVTAFSRWQRAEIELKKPVEQGGGEVIKAPNGYMQVNPWLSIATMALKEMRAYLPHFGLSPKSRGEAKAQGKPENDALIAFFSGKPDGKKAR